jgi:hypothetical protein
MKNKGLLILMVAGMMVVVVGSLFRIINWPGSTVILIVGLATEVIALGKLVIRSLMAPSRNKE